MFAAGFALAPAPAPALAPFKISYFDLLISGNKNQQLIFLLDEELVFNQNVKSSSCRTKEESIEYYY